MIKTKKQMYTVIGAFILVMLLTTVTYAFFNYTRTGVSNTIKTGRIYFNAEQGDTVTLSDLFPISLEASQEVSSETPGVGSLTIHVTGDTMYDNGIEYLVKAVDVTNSTGGVDLPISIAIKYEETSGKTIGMEDEEYFTNRGGNSSLYKVLSTDSITDDGDLVVGYIAKGQTGIDGTITIMAYLDAKNIAISDTYNETSPETDLNGTTTEWVEDRTVLTTSEWNSLQTNGVSFKIKVEANEGIWVENPNLAWKVINQVDGLKNVAGAKRYVGGDTTTNNYVYFNGDEKWRIIGIYGDQLKIVKADNPITNKAYNEYSETATNTWEGSTLEIYLNGDYYDSLTSTAKNMIAESIWNIGKSSENATAVEAYSLSQDDTWTGKVGMVAAYEFLYGASDDNCYNIAGNHGSYYTTCGQELNNWFFPNNVSGRIWSITAQTTTTNNAIGYATELQNVIIYGPMNVLPAVYLKSSVVINGGDGSINTPYELQ